MSSFHITAAEQCAEWNLRDVCGKCKCVLIESNKEFWCSSRDEFACVKCADTIEKCDDELCVCCHDLDCDCELCFTEEEEYRFMMLLGLAGDEDEETP